MSERQLKQRTSGYLTAAALLLSCLLTVTCAAAERMATRTAYHIGGSLTDWRGRSSDGKEIDFGLGGTVGVSRSFHVRNEFLFQPELNLSIRDVHLQYDYHIGSGSLTFEEEATLYYLELPMIAKFPYRWHEAFVSSVYIGPVWSVSLGGKRSGKYVSHLDNIPSGDYSGSIGNLETMDFGIALGWDFHFGPSTRRYIIDFRFILGLKDVFADVDDPGKTPDDQFPFSDPITGKNSEFRSGSFLLFFGFDTSR